MWVYEEDCVAAGREIIEKFRGTPDAAEFQSAGATAEELRTAAAARDRQIRKNIVDVRSQWTNPNPAQRPLTFILILLSVIVGMLTSFGGEPSISSAGTAREEADPRAEALLAKLKFARQRHANGLGPDSDVRRGEVWRLVTPIFIHYGVLHLLFNMLWLHSLGSAIEVRRGSLRFLLLVLFVAVTSNVAQCLWSGPSFGGMSGVVFGLFGYIWMKSRFDPRGGLFIDSGTVTMMLFWLVICMTGAIGPVANAAHLVGLVAGVAAGFAPIAWRRVTG